MKKFLYRSFITASNPSVRLHAGDTEFITVRLDACAVKVVEFTTSKWTALHCEEKLLLGYMYISGKYLIIRRLTGFGNLKFFCERFSESISTGT